MKFQSSVIAAFFLCLLASCSTRTPTPEPQPTTNTMPDEWPGDISGFFYPVELTPEIKAVCASSILKMELMYDAKNEQPANTMDEAQRLIWRNISIAITETPRSCVEYDGWFLISSLNAANPDEGSFKTGIAVKKGRTGIYKWN